MCIFKFSSE